MIWLHKNLTVVLFLLALVRGLSAEVAEQVAPSAPSEGVVVETKETVKVSDSEKPILKASEENPSQSQDEEGSGVVDEKDAEAKEEAEDSKHAEEPVESTQIFGWKEWVQVGTKADRMRAKLDSGARTSSLHAEGIEEFERDGRNWVRFSIRNFNEEGSKSVLIKAPVQRVAKVKNTDGTMSRRIVVELGFSIGDRHLRDEFTLNDRLEMTCPVLIGRNVLRHLGLVDCSRVDLARRKLFK